MAKKFLWRAISGNWDKYQLDNGNIVMRQSWAHDRHKTDSPTPFLQYKTIQINPKIKDPRYADTVKLKFRVQNFYSSMGELAIFFGGNSVKEVYYIRFQFHNKFFYNISLLRSFIKNPDRPMKVFGNYYTKNYASSFISIPTSNTKELKLKRDKKGIKVFLDNNLIFEYKKSVKNPWTYFPKTYFAVGTRGAHIWIDDIMISRRGRILFRDDFTKDLVKRYRLKIRKIKSQDRSTPTSPR